MNYVLLSLLLATFQLDVPQDKDKLVGKWNLDYSTYYTKGKEGKPDKPIFPATWEFTADGKCFKKGGNALSGTYILKGKMITMNLGLPMPLEYEILELTDTKMKVTSKIESGGKVIFQTNVYLTKIK